MNRPDSLICQDRRRRRRRRREGGEEELLEDMYLLPREYHVTAFFILASSDGAEAGTRE
jgi:hypothetical protein